MFDLTGKTALVTGASGGIGRTIAIMLSEAGARVGLSGTRAAVLEAVQAELPGESAVLPCDLSDDAQTRALVKRTEEALGPLDILVANAGITRDGLMVRMGDDDWNTVITLDLGAYFRLAKASLRGMMKRRYGRIIAISSIVGVTGNPGQANYCAAKAGMIGMTKSLAQEIAGRGITANTVAPGFIRSPMTDVLPETQKTSLLERIPAGRLGEGRDVAGAVIYLASEQAAYVTGQTLHVNGGMAMI